jgi:hypothetical protein
MTWELPRYPTKDIAAICRYWHLMADIPANEPGAEMIREMAQARLLEIERGCPVTLPVPPSSSG